MDFWETLGLMSQNFIFKDDEGRERLLVINLFSR